MADQESVPLTMTSRTRICAGALLGAALLLPGCFAPDLMPAGTSGTDSGSSSTGSPTTDTPTTGSTGTPGSTTETPTTGVDTETTGPTTGDPTLGDTSTGDDTTSTTGGADETGSSSTGMPVTCGDGGVCISAVPEGWNGPVATRTLDIEDDIPPCGGDAYTDLQVSDAFGGLAAQEYECGCSCSAGDLSCEGSATLELSDYPPMAGLSPCTDPDYVYNETIASGAPQSVSIPMDDIRGIILDGAPTSDLVGSCDPSSTVTPTQAGFSTRTIACGTFDVEAEGCGDGVCVPQPAAPYDAPVCIWAEGDLECPAGFDDRTVYHSEYTDTRDCSACSCGAPEGGCGQPSIEIRGWCDDDDLICFGGPPGCGPGGSIACEETLVYGTGAINFCEPIDTMDFCTPLCTPPDVCLHCDITHTLIELRDITYDAGIPFGSCSPNGGTPMGDVAGADATTLCCSG